jgi:hypothetical protein
MAIQTQRLSRSARRSAQLPPVEVICNRCGHRWSSRAKRHASIRCPHCGQSTRVRRSADAVAAGDPAPIDLPRQRRDPAPGALFPGLPFQVEDHEDEDGETYLKDASGALVLGEWTWDGRLIPAATATVDYAAELGARDWMIDPHGIQFCELVHLKPHGWQYGAPARPCTGHASRRIPGGVICEACHDALSHPIAPL